MRVIRKINNLANSELFAREDLLNSGNSRHASTDKQWKVQKRAVEVRRLIKVLGKLCPSCGLMGPILCETQERIIYECQNGHQYETKKRLCDVLRS